MPGSSRLLCVLIGLSFSLLSSSSWYEYTTFCLTTYLLKDIWAVYGYGNNNAVNIHVQAFVWTYVFSSSGSNPSM